MPLRISLGLNMRLVDGLKSGKQAVNDKAQDILKRLGSSWGLLSMGFGLTLVHLFWYGSVWTAWLALVCYAPFLAWLRLYCRRPFLAGWVFGLFYAVMNNYWLGQFIGKWTQSVFIGGLAVFIVGAVWGMFSGAAAAVTKRLIPLDGWARLAIPFVLFLPDLLRSYIPEFAYPFTPLGEPLVAYWLIARPLAHCYFASFVVCCSSALFSFGSVEKLPVHPALVGVAPFLVAILLKANQTPITTPTKIALGQLGFDLAYTEDGQKPFKIREATNDLIRQARAQKADVLILPEAVAAFSTIPNTAFDLPPDLPVLFGAQRGTSPRYQSAYLWDTKGFQFTDKTRLVVFGEYVPLRGVIPYPAGFQLPAGDLAEGEAKLLTLPNGLKLGTMICFESLFPGAARNLNNLEPDVLSIISLDDWYMGTSAIPRLEIAARWRAVETGKWIFRVGSLGKTMVIDPKGRVRAELPTGERRLLVYQL